MLKKKVGFATLALGLLTVFVPATAMARDWDDGNYGARSERHEFQEHARRERRGERARWDRDRDAYRGYQNGYQNGYYNGYNSGYQNGYYDQSGYWHPNAR